MHSSFYYSGTSYSPETSTTPQRARETQEQQRKETRKAAHGHQQHTSELSTATAVPLLSFQFPTSSKNGAMGLIIILARPQAMPLFVVHAPLAIPGISLLGNRWDFIPIIRA